MQDQTAVAAVSAATQGVQALSAATAAPPAGLALLVGKLEYFIVVPLVYLSIAFFAVALVARIAAILRSPPPPYQLALYPLRKRPLWAAMVDSLAMPQIRRKKPLFWFFLASYHLGFILLILGHLDILPNFDLVPPASRDMLGAGLVGLMVTVPTFYFLGRRFKGVDRVISTPGDYLLLILLLFTFLFGDLMSWGNSWTRSGFVMTKADFARYFDGLLRFTFADPRLDLQGSHYHFLVIHVLLADLVFIVLPFTKVIHAFLSLPLNIARRKPWIRG